MLEQTQSAQPLTTTLKRVFNQILLEDMAGIPILNHRLRVVTLGFQEYEGRQLGILITPWMMQLMLFPKSGDDWDTLETGKKIPQRFPSGTLKFMVNRFPDIGVCQTHSLYSPMGEFAHHEHAEAAAASFLETLFIPADDKTPAPTLDPEESARLIRGEEGFEVDLNSFARVAPQPEPEQKPTLAQRVESPLSRRDLLRGKFLQS